MYCLAEQIQPQGFAVVPYISSKQMKGRTVGGERRVVSESFRAIAIFCFAFLPKNWT